MTKEQSLDRLSVPLCSLMVKVNLELEVSWTCEYWKLSFPMIPELHLQVFRKNYFSWSLVDIQCCISFRYTAKWFSFIYIYIYIHTHTHIEYTYMFSYYVCVYIYCYCCSVMSNCDAVDCSMPGLRVCVCVYTLFNFFPL